MKTVSYTNDSGGSKWKPSNNLQNAINKDKLNNPDKYKPNNGATVAGKPTGNNMQTSWGGAGITNGGYGSSSSSSSGGSYYGPQYFVPEMDFSLFDQLMNTAREGYNSTKGHLSNAYNTSKNNLKLELDRMIESLGKERQRGNESFGQGRSTIAENAYDRTRAGLNDLASRGLAGSGLEQLGNVQERMETGRQMSGLAGEYYNLLDELADAEQAGQDSFNANNVALDQNYNAGISQLEQALQQQLDAISMNKWNAQNAYNQQIADANYKNAQASAYNTSGYDNATVNLSNALALVEQGYSAETASRLAGVDINELSSFVSSNKKHNEALNKQQQDSLLNQKKQGALNQLKYGNMKNKEKEEFIKGYNESVGYDPKYMLDYNNFKPTSKFITNTSYGSYGSPMSVGGSLTNNPRYLSGR